MIRGAPRSTLVPYTGSHSLATLMTHSSRTVATNNGSMIGSVRLSPFRIAILVLAAYSFGYHQGLRTSNERMQLEQRQCRCGTGEKTASTAKVRVAPAEEAEAEAKREKEMILPFQHTAMKEFLPNRKTDAYNYFHKYFSSFARVNPNAPIDRKSTRLELQSHHDLVCRLLLEKKKTHTHKSY